MTRHRHFSNEKFIKSWKGEGGRTDQRTGGHTMCHLPCSLMFLKIQCYYAGLYKCYNIYNMKFTILTILSIQPSGTKYIHIVVQPSPPSISTTLPSPQHSAHFTPGPLPPKTNDPCLVDVESQLLMSRAQSSSHISLSHTGVWWNLFTWLFLRFTWHFNHQFLRIWWQGL